MLENHDVLFAAPLAAGQYPDFLHASRIEMVLRIVIHLKTSNQLRGCGEAKA